MCCTFRDGEHILKKKHAQNGLCECVRIKAEILADAQTCDMGEQIRHEGTLFCSAVVMGTPFVSIPTATA